MKRRIFLNNGVVGNNGEKISVGDGKSCNRTIKLSGKNKYDLDDYRDD